MLFPKPIILIMKGNSGHHEVEEASPKKVTKAKKGSGDEMSEKLLDEEEGTSPAPIAVSGGDDPFKREVYAPKIAEEHSDGAGEIFIHQLIEVIEFALGSVSNTASYLRLWALSLAHSQLAKVFLDMTVLSGIKSHNFIAVITMYPLYVACTIGVLMCMDLMECFLHALRLHW